MSKTTTEIILELDAKVSKIEGLLTNIDFNQKLILNMLRKHKATPTQELDVLPKRALMVETFSDISQSIPMEAKASPKQEAAKTPANDNKRSIYQKLQHKSGRNIVLANIIILDESNKQLKKTRTNSAGKWSVRLPAGNYTVKIEKGQTEFDPRIQDEFTFEAVESLEPLELSTKIY